VSIKGTLEPSKMRGCLISGVDTLRGMQFKRPHRPRIVLHPSHDTPKHGQIHSIAVDVAMCLFVTIRCRRGRFPNFDGNKTQRLIESWESKFASDPLVLQPC
jgi:hypothetical protein